MFGFVLYFIYGDEMKTVHDLLNISCDIEVKGITDDSREVKEGYLFVATHGFHEDHFDYIQQAMDAGACFLVVDKDPQVDFPHIIVDHIDSFYRELCQKFYDLNFSQFHFIGITGTDGKTTTATVLSRLLDDCAYLGTNGLTIHGKTIPTNNTTPCVSELYRDLSMIQKEGISTVSMEVSSEALFFDRVKDLSFDVVCFTNVTGDHLNTHKTMEEYFACKKKLLDLLKKDGLVVLNGDDSYLQTIAHPNLLTFGFGEENMVQIQSYKEHQRGSSFVIHQEKESLLIESPLPGKYNAYNVTMASLVASYFGVDSKRIQKEIKELSSIQGRAEFLDFGQEYDILLDYAHTINGIRTILDTFQDYHRVIVVTGAAGGREKEKRPVIGKMIIEKSDIAIFTMDDPRNEDVNDIINQMVGEEKDYIRISHREEAIFYALSIASKGDIVLILGKGRDNYMAIGNEKVPYCDYDVIEKFFQKKRA